MAKSKFGFLSRISRAKGKLVSAFRKIVPRSHDEQRPDFERFSATFAPRSPAFSYTQTPSTAYHRRNPAVRSASGNFIQHFDPTLDIFWPEPVDSPPRSSVYQHQNFRWLGARYEDGSSVAWHSSNSAESSWQTVAETSDIVMSSLLRGLPEPPHRTPRLRRQQGRSNLRPANQQASIFTACNVERSQTATAADTPDLASEAESRQPAIPDHDHYPQPSVSEAVQVQVFTPSALEGSLGSPGPTIRGSDPSSMGEFQASPRPSIQHTHSFAGSSRRGPSSRPSLRLLIDRRPRNPVVRDFALGSDVLADPFVTTPGPATTNTATNATSAGRLWSDFSSSSDSRPSPVYMGNGRYRLCDGTIHRITTSERSRRRSRDASHVDVGSLEAAADENSSDEANHADTSDPYSGESARSSRPSPVIAVHRLDNAVRNLERVASPDSETRQAIQQLAIAVDDVVRVVDSLIHDMEVHAFNAEERRRNFADQTTELEGAHEMIVERDREINRLRNPEQFGEEITPPIYSSDIQARHESVMRTPSEPLAAVRHASHTRAPSSPTPGAQEQRGEEVSRFSDDSDESETSSLQPTAEQVSVSSAPPPYRDDSPENETSPPTLTLTPETIVRHSPPSSEAAESDNVMLVRTPRHRYRSLRMISNRSFWQKR